MVTEVKHIFFKRKLKQPVNRILWNTYKIRGVEIPWLMYLTCLGQSTYSISSDFPRKCSGGIVVPLLQGHLFYNEQVALQEGWLLLKGIIF